MIPIEIQGWGMFSIALILLIRTFVGDGKKGMDRLNAEIALARAEIANSRAMLSDFQLKVAQEYTRNDQLGPRLERIENMLTEVLTGRRNAH